MRVSWRQAIRTGKNDGKLIEDDGVYVDYYVPQTREDLENPPNDIEGYNTQSQTKKDLQGYTPKGDIQGYNTQSQYETISSRLEKIGIADGRRFLSFEIIQRHESGILTPY
jgi:hypothetical protein